MVLFSSSDLCVDLHPVPWFLHSPHTVCHRCAVNLLMWCPYHQMSFPSSQCHPNLCSRWEPSMLQSSAPCAFIVLHEFSLLPSRLFFSDSLYPSLPPSIFLCPLDPFLISALVLWQILPSSYSLKFGLWCSIHLHAFFTFVQREHSASRGSCRKIVRTPLFLRTLPFWG